METHSSSLVQKFKHGFKSHWVTDHGVQVSVAATLLSIAGGLIFAIKDGGKLRNIMVTSEKSSSKNHLTIPGLQNLGNNCFLNVVLQVKITSFLIFVDKKFVFLRSDVRALANLMSVFFFNSDFLEFCKLIGDWSQFLMI